MPDDVAIRLDAVGKRYTKYEDAPALVNATKQLLTRTRRSQLWAVRGVDLQVTPGECLGVIGRNGSGKSTLLQMLCGVTAPTEGRVRVRGRIAPLISVGVGFHPELTGRENVYVNATILGLRRKDIDRRFDEIVDFSGIEQFIDTPVKFYSSGMFVRLGFSVAIQVDPEVLLVDEVLAVGDLAFQMKCYERMRAIREQGATVVFVTHNLTIVRNLCDRVIVMDGGRKQFDGDAEPAINRFHELLGETREPEGADIGWAVHRGGIGRIEVEGLYDGRKRTHSLSADRPFIARLKVTAVEELRDAYVGVALHSADGTLVFAQADFETTLPTLPAGQERHVDVHLRPALVTGTYALSAGLYQRPQGPGKQVQLSVSPGTSFHLAGRPLAHGIADLEARFDTGAGDADDATTITAGRRGSRRAGPPASAPGRSGGRPR
jgi:ABC-2 type transport system ATP-binding protein